MHLLLQAYWELLKTQRFLSRSDFAAVYRYVSSGAANCDHDSANRLLEISRAIDTACVWFWKEVSCLHRSAVTAHLLRKNGIAAELVIGAQSLPFQGHAWVEVGGQVVNDKPYIAEIYPVLDRF
jgi:hypothetical protein